MMKKFWDKVHVGSPEQCWPAKGTPEKSGYVHVKVDGRAYYAHRFAYFIAVGDIPDGHVVRHRCNNSVCCNPAHLLSGTQAQNNADTRASGHAKIGSAHHWAKMTETKVVEALFAHYTEGRSIKDLAEAYDLDYSTMWAILTGRQWKHVYDFVMAEIR
jgi:hypothetical protein